MDLIPTYAPADVTTTEAPAAPQNPARPTCATLAALKAAGEDFEWYPTTDAMLYAVARHCSDVWKLLDIGAGDGRALVKIDLYRRQIEDSPESQGHRRASMELYAIEKAITHIDAMPAGISIIGTDFFLQSLIDKEMDAVFCNPPYSQYEDFAVKIIKEAFAREVFLILPDRWKESPLIKKAIESRKARQEIIWSGDFESADRKARARVDVVKISIRKEGGGYYSHKEKADPFDVWFSEVFPEFDKVKASDEDDEDTTSRSKAGRIKPGDIIPGQNLIERLAEMYRAEMDNLYSNYRALCSIDAALLQELGVKHDEIKQGLRSKIAGTKNKYWAELFDRLDKITSRLTKASREAMLARLKGCCTIDYTADNAYAVVMWAVKNANQYYNEQLCTLFKDLSEPENVKNYKSNKKTWEKGRWRFKEQHPTHYTLDYRIVTTQHRAIYNGDGYGKYDYPGGLHQDSHSFLKDILTVANNLGFVSDNDTTARAWAAGQEQTFYTIDRDGKGQAAGRGNCRALMAVRAYKNGNIHIKFDQTFIKTLNIEASRLLGWINSPKQAAEEMKDAGITEAFAREVFGKANKQFLPAEGKLLLTA